MRLFLIIFFLKFSHFLIKGDTESYICSSTFCDEWLQKNSCPELPKKCSIQNTTHNGVILPYAGPCNCCTYCLENLREGEACTIGHIGSGIPSSVCGPGLACIQDNNTKTETCQRMITDCTKAQDDYDNRRANGTLGNMEVRPVCDGDGQFKSYKCIPGQSCFCLDTNNNRIFGEIDYTDTPEYHLKCQCSRNFEKIRKIFDQSPYSSQYFRCTENGDYDTLQCIEDKCFCTDASDGAISDPTADAVNITLISNKTLPCFDQKRHNSSGHYHPQCTLEVIDILKKIEEIENKYGTDREFNIKFPNCSLDGRYAPVQENSTHYYCANPDSGEPLEDYSIDKTDPNAKNIDCKCARTRLVTSGNLNECCKCCSNGNFNKIQCRRGYCRCVNDNGYQIEKELPESDIEQLSCYTNQC